MDTNFFDTKSIFLLEEKLYLRGQKNNSLTNLYYLFHILGAYAHVGHQLLSKDNFNLHQSGMLLNLRLQEEGISQAKLAEILCVKPSSVASMINTLEKQEMLRRTPDPLDKRINRIYLTEQGLELTDRLLEKLGEMSDAFFGSFSEEEKEGFQFLIKKLAENMFSAIEQLDH